MAVGLCFYGLRKYSTPEGMFDSPQVSSIHYGYIEFKDGKVLLKVHGADLPFGEYSQENGRWIWIRDSGHKLYVVGTWRELRTYTPEGQEERSFSRLKRLYVRP